MFFQLVSTVPPSGVTSPRPVTTTRRIFPNSVYASKTNGLPICFGKPFVPPSGAGGGSQRTRSALVLVDIGDGVTDRCDLLRGIVWDLDPELLLERHDQLDTV